MARPTNEERAARRRKASIVRAIDRLPELLDHAATTATDPSVSAAVRIQMLQILPKIADLIPDLGEELRRVAVPEGRRVGGGLSPAEAEALRQLCLLGLLGRVEPIDQPYEADPDADRWRGRTLPEITKELAERQKELGERREQLAREERELEERAKEIETLRRHLDAVELRGLAPLEER